MTTRQRARDVSSCEADRPGDLSLEGSVPGKAGEGVSRGDAGREGLAKAEVDEEAKLVHPGSERGWDVVSLRKEREDEGTARVHGTKRGTGRATLSPPMKGERCRVERRDS